MEIEGSDRWYFERSPDASDQFVFSVYDAIEAICHAPSRSPAYLYGARRYLLRKFPFAIVYLDTPDLVKIVAVAHHKRRPGYWKGRL